MKKQKNKLTPKQREEIIVLRFEKNWGLREIAEKFGVTTQNISYYVRLHRQKEERKANEPKPKTLEQELDPVDFRIMKLKQITEDLQLARNERVIHALPTFHKLHIAVHNELREFVSANKDIQNLDSDSLINEMVEMISTLPISLQTIVYNRLEIAQMPNVINLKTP
mgnify:CR=1 FL=1